MSKFTKGTWELNKHFDVVSENGQFVALCCIRHKKLGYHYIESIKLYNEETKANARLIAAAPEMYEMITKLVDSITIVELLNRMQVVKVNPVLIESAKRLLAEIDGEVEHE